MIVRLPHLTRDAAIDRAERLRAAGRAVELWSRRGGRVWTVAVMCDDEDLNDVVRGDLLGTGWRREADY